jgi:predicted transcriptional regulator
MTTIFRVEKNREFVVMSNKFLREKGMSLKAKGLLALCLALPDTWEYSINGLCAICKESQTSIRSALKELESFGHLKRERKQNEKGQFIYEYVIYETPYNGFQHTVKQHTEKAHTGNRRQQSNKRQTIKKENINNDFMGKLKSMYEEENDGK